MHLIIYFQQNDLEIGKGYNLNSKKLKLVMVSSFDPHSMCGKVEMSTAKAGCTSCTNWTISFKVRGFHTKTHLFQRHFIFLNLFQLKTFFCIQHATFKATYQIFNPFSLNFLFFMHLMIYFELNDPVIGKHYN